MRTRPAKILLVTERPLLVLAFRELLNAAGMGLEHTVLGPQELEHSLRADVQTLVVIDSEARIAWKVLAGLVQSSPNSKFVFWCDTVTPEQVQAALEARLHGLLSTQFPLTDAADAMVRIWGGDRQFRFAGELRRHVKPDPGLTPREEQVVSLVMAGRKNREIAVVLHTTEGSVKVYLNRIFAKTSTRSRHELALVARGLIRRLQVLPRNKAPEPPEAPDFDAAWMFTGGQPTTKTLGEA